jgi:hypothetical protein
MMRAWLCVWATRAMEKKAIKRGSRITRRERMKKWTAERELM